jgi:drug/metabolite transporter (DMT)-like permease
MSTDIDLKNISPFKQVAAVFACLLVFMLMGKVTSDDPRFPWIVVCAMLLFFTVLNSLLSIPVEEPQHYWWKSIVSYVFLAVVGGFVAYGVSGLTINEAGSSSWLYIVFSVGYLVFISIINLIKFIIFLAQRQENKLHSEDSNP